MTSSNESAMKQCPHFFATNMPQVLTAVGAVVLLLDPLGRFVAPLLLVVLLVNSIANWRAHRRWVPRTTHAA
jgi:hypothetical protein